MTTPTYDWEYLICAPGKPAWDEFDANHGTYATQPFSNRDFDPGLVGEMIAEDQGLTGSNLILMRDPHGNNFACLIQEEKVSSYRCDGITELGKKR
jgi:hypothetical protein